MLLHTALSNSTIADTHASSSFSFCAHSSQIQTEKPHKPADFLCWLMSFFLTWVEGIQSLLEESHILMPSDSF